MSFHASEFHKDNFTWYQSETGILQMKLFWLSIQNLDAFRNLAGLEIGKHFLQIWMS